jgi:peptide/nickel transport system substrate-binding protein
MTKGDLGAGKKLLTRREFLVGGGAVIAAVALTACTSKTPSVSTSSNTSPGSAPSTSSTAMTPKYGGTLKVIQTPMPANIGWPAEMVGYSGAMTNCAETLLRDDHKGNLVPWLAESFKVADDLKSITFNIRKGVKFHDGSDLNAGAVKWNLDNYIQSKMQPYWASAETIDDYTLRVYFTQWKNTLPVSFGDIDPPAFIISKASFDSHGKDWMMANPVGTGPFRYRSFQQDVSLELEKNPDYWVKGKPYLDGVKVTMATDPTTIKMLVQSGEEDIIANVSDPKDAAAYSAMGLKVTARPFINWGLIPDTANSSSPWAKQQVREAVDYAIDREGIAKAFGYGYYQPLYQIPPRYTLTYEPNFPLARKYNPDKAQQLLAEAGFSSGFDTTIIAMPMGSRDVTVSIQENLAKIGIKANLDYPEMGKWVTYMGPGTWPTNSVLYTLFPAMDSYYNGGLQWLNVQLGQSWMRTPEFLK